MKLKLQTPPFVVGVAPNDLSVVITYAAHINYKPIFMQQSKERQLPSSQILQMRILSEIYLNSFVKLMSTCDTCYANYPVVLRRISIFT
jgi:hypothetical protein